ncbi:unnamed protein product [Brassica oleracea var. botrytis]
MSSPLSSPEYSRHVSGDSTSWLKGCVLMVTSNILWGLWLVLQDSTVCCGGKVERKRTPMMRRQSNITKMMPFAMK